MAAPGVDAVIFDWGGTLTPWHEVDLGEQWRVFAREIHGVDLASPEVSSADLDAAHALADRILAVESKAWAQGQQSHASASLDDVLAAAELDPEHDRHLLALAAYRRFWEPHTYTDPQVRPLWEGLRERGSASVCCPTRFGAATTTGRSFRATGCWTSSTPTSTPPSWTM